MTKPIKSAPGGVKNQIRLKAESDLEAFIRLVHPGRVLGSIHLELINWWTKKDAKSHQLVLLPRDHGKSAMAAYRAAWEIARNPLVRILYVSSTSNLAVKQLKFIKDILTSDTFRFYWPDIVNEEEFYREKWTETEIVVDHPSRKVEAIRDPTIFCSGLTTTVTGMHFDVTILDDIVVRENAYTQEGRDKVEAFYSLLASVEATESVSWVVGTRYHPNDLYEQMMSREYEVYGEDNEPIFTEHLYEKFERQVESQGDGTGEFLWPRQQRYDGKWFGFDANILSKKRSQYLDRTQFRAQYYNNPNSAEDATVSREYFQYYNREHITRKQGKWFYKATRINVFASIDFAYSLSRKADYTSIVVVGIDPRHQYYVLDIDRFKTDKISDYFDHILRLHQKWDFRKLRAEVTAAQKIIVKDLKTNYVQPHGLSLVIEDNMPSRYQGSKEERIEATLQPRYNNRQIWHYEGGNCQILEDELVLQNPPHDDVKDCLAACIDICIAPSLQVQEADQRVIGIREYIASGRFGGIV